MYFPQGRPATWQGGPYLKFDEITIFACIRHYFPRQGRNI